MSTLDVVSSPIHRPPGVSAVDDRRGTGAMICVIATEAALFTMLFFAYFYLARGGWRWLNEKPPALPLALLMLVVLLSSSAVLMWGERQLQRRRFGTARAAIAGTILIGTAFLAIQFFEFRNHLQQLTPRTNVYGSIFYTITSFHAAHVVVGLIILAYVLLLPYLEPVDRPPHRPYHNVALYWHFVDFVWIWIVTFLYVAPNIR